SIANDDTRRFRPNFDDVRIRHSLSPAAAPGCSNDAASEKFQWNRRFNSTGFGGYVCASRNKAVTIARRFDGAVGRDAAYAANSRRNRSGFAERSPPLAALVPKWGARAITVGGSRGQLQRGRLPVLVDADIGECAIGDENQLRLVRAHDPSLDTYR